MRNIIYYNVQDMIKKNQDFKFIIDDIDKTIKDNELNINIHNNLIKQLTYCKKNIIAIYNNKLIGFCIISEKVISNVYIKNTLFYKKYFDILMNEAMEYLDTTKPYLILSREDTIKNINYILEHNWNSAAITKDKRLFFNSKTKFEKQLIKEYKKY